MSGGRREGGRGEGWGNVGVPYAKQLLFLSRSFFHLLNVRTLIHPIL